MPKKTKSNRQKNSLSKKNNKIDDKIISLRNLLKKCKKNNKINLNEIEKISFGIYDLNDFVKNLCESVKGQFNKKTKKCVADFNKFINMSMNTIKEIPSTSPDVEKKK